MLTNIKNIDRINESGVITTNRSESIVVSVSPPPIVQSVEPINDTHATGNHNSVQRNDIDFIVPDDEIENEVVALENEDDVVSISSSSNDSEEEDNDNIEDLYEYAQTKLDIIPLSVTAEYSKSNRALCRKCRKKIYKNKGILRFAVKDNHELIKSIRKVGNQPSYDDYLYDNKTFIHYQCYTATIDVKYVQLRFDENLTVEDKAIVQDHFDECHGLNQLYVLK